jgi:hypothetical protein
MTTEEKLRAMLILWHENVLKEREQRLRDGKDKFVDWDQAKKDIHKPLIELI